MSKKQSCRTCELWDIAKATNSAGQVRKHTVAPCLWKLSEPLPSSAWRAGISVSWTSRDDGTDCRCHKERATPLQITEEPTP